MRKLLIVFITIFLVTNVMNAQTVKKSKTIKPNQNQGYIQFQFVHPSFDGDDDFSIISGAYMLSGYIPVSNKLGILASLPFSMYSANDESESALGNVFLGVKGFLDARNTMSLTGGVFIPTAGSEDEAAAVNFLSYLGNYMHFQNYIPERLTIFADWNIKQPLNNLFWGLGISNSLFFYTGDEDLDTEDVLQFRGQFGYEKLNFIGADFSFNTLWVITSDADDTFFHSVKLGVYYHGADFQPKLFVEVPTDGEWSDVVSMIIGLQFQYFLK